MHAWVPVEGRRGVSTFSENRNRLGRKEWKNECIQSDVREGIIKKPIMDRVCASEKVLDSNTDSGEAAWERMQRKALGVGLNERKLHLGFT